MVKKVDTQKKKTKVKEGKKSQNYILEIEILKDH
jgi:hypothetical protein